VTFPPGLLTIIVTGSDLQGLDGSPLTGVIIFSASGPISDPAVSAVLEGAAVANVTDGVITPPLVIPTTDCVSPPFTYAIELRLEDADGSTSPPPPVEGVSIPSSLGASVDISRLL
jgi:hypothetical protein